MIMAAVSGCGVQYQWTNSGSQWLWRPVSMDKWRLSAAVASSINGLQITVHHTMAAISGCGVQYNGQMAAVSDCDVQYQWTSNNSISYKETALLVRVFFFAGLLFG